MADTINFATAPGALANYYAKLAEKNRAKLKAFEDEQMSDQYPALEPSSPETDAIAADQNRAPAADAAKAAQDAHAKLKSNAKPITEPTNPRASSGDSSRVKQDLSTTSTATKQERSFLDILDDSPKVGPDGKVGPSSAALFQHIMQGQRDLPESQKVDQGQKEFESALAMEKIRPRPRAPMSLQGLMGLVDLANDNKTNFYSEYQTPKRDTSEDDYQLKRLSLEDKAQDDRLAILKSRLEGLGKLGGGNDFSSVAAKLNDVIDNKKANQAPRVTGTGNPVNNYHKWVGEVDKQFKANDTSTDEVNKLSSEIASKNPIDDSRIAIVRSALDAHGRPNMAEVKLESGNRAIFEKLPQAWSFFMKGKLTDSNRELYLQSFDVISKALLLERQAKTRMLMKMARNYGVSEDAARDRLPLEYTEKAHPRTEAEKKATALAAPAGSTDAEIQTQLDEIKKMRETLDQAKKAQGGK
jgi:hypothetical protein